MMLFIWTEFSPDYKGGLAFAIAKDVIEAQEMVEEQIGYHIYDWGKLEIKPLNRKIARAVSGGG